MSNKSFSYTNMLKGNITQAILKTLLEDSEYSVVPFGIEEVFREIKEMNDEDKVNIPTVLWKMPDFIILNKCRNDFRMVEVKYRKQFNIQTKKSLKKELAKQLKSWNPLFLILFLGNVSEPHKPSKIIRATKLTLDEKENILVSTNKNDNKPIEAVRFWELPRVQDIFTNLSEQKKYDGKTISQIIPLIEAFKSLEKHIEKWADYCISEVVPKICTVC